jgi:hypothetical protein
MATEAAVRRYRAWYALLLRLYPGPFRERFGEGMAQTFCDVCRERGDARWGVFGLALWMYFETFVGIVRENTTQMPEMGKTMLRVALVALGLLMVPLVASRVVPGWNWPAGTFVFVYVLFFGTGMAYAVIARRMGAWPYKAGVGMALVTGFVLGWSSMVHVTGTENPANFAYYSVLVVGCVGAWVARLEARGLARTLFAMAGLLGLIALLLPSGAPPEMARRMATGHGVEVALFTASGLLFRRASVGGVK